MTEDALVAAIAEALQAPARKLALGIGDDAAAWKPGKHHLSLITTDMLVDGVHFRSSGAPPDSLGHKALAENLSDIAAMGGSPVLCVVALGLGEHVEESWVREFYRGLSILGRSAGCAVAGGDIVRSAALTIGITVVGEVKRSRMKTRAGARAGDVIALSGPLGFSMSGLRLMDSGCDAQVPRQSADLVYRAHLKPTPRLGEGKFFGSCRTVHAMMDISDGLSTDLGRMARSSGVDAALDEDCLLPHPAVASVAAALDRDPAEFTLHGGDDYELLVAIEPRAYSHVAQAFERRFSRKLRSIGKFVTGNGCVRLNAKTGKQELIPAGYDHLRAWNASGARRTD